jgi:hypothetical protein
MSVRGSGFGVAVMGVQKNRSLLLQARQAAGKIPGKPLKVIGAHLIDDDQDGELWR